MRAKLMAVGLILNACLSLLAINVNAENVDVVEAVPVSSQNSKSADQPEREEPSNVQVAQHREDNDIEDDQNPDQTSLENGPDQEGSASAKHGYVQNLPSLALPPSGRGPPHYGIGPKPPPFSNHHIYHAPNQLQVPIQKQPPPPPDNIDKVYNAVGGASGGEQWPLAISETPKIINLDVKCEKNSMKVFIGFDKPFYGIVFSKGHYSNLHCVHLPAGLGRTSATFEIGIHACGTTGNTENGLYGYGADSGSGTYFENIIVVQYDAQVQEVWDQARKLRCTWHDQYEKSVTFRPFPVDMLDVVRADFAGDNVGCWMQIQVGKGPWASEVSGLVKIGQTMTMVLAIKDDDSKFDMLVRNCMAHDGKRAPIQLVDQKGCVTRPKLMSKFTKIKNFGASASVLSYAHFQAFKFPDSMEVHFQCTIQICRYQCPDPCSADSNVLPPQQEHLLSVRPEGAYGPPLPPQIPIGHPHGLALDYGPIARRDERRKKHKRDVPDPEQDVGLNKIIKVVSNGDLTFSLDDSAANYSSAPTIVFPAKEFEEQSSKVCLSSFGFSATLVFLLTVLFASCLISIILCIRLRSPRKVKKKIIQPHQIVGIPMTNVYCNS